MSFDISRLRRSDQIVGISAIALFVFLFFFKWYGGSAELVDRAASTFSSSVNGWDTFTQQPLDLAADDRRRARRRGHRRGRAEAREPRAAQRPRGGPRRALDASLILYRIVHHPSGGASGTIAGVHYSSSSASRSASGSA